MPSSTSPDSLFSNASALARAEGTLMTGVAERSWTANGLALLVDRADETLDILGTLAVAIAGDLDADNVPTDPSRGILPMLHAIESHLATIARALTPATPSIGSEV